MVSSSSRSWGALTPPLAEWILQAVTSMGLQRMTPVQASTIGLLGGNNDVVVEAVTGSGKTLAFLIPTIQRILRLEDPNKKHHVAGIIISPTRELAKQTHDVLVALLGFHSPSAQALQPQEIEDASVKDDVYLENSAETSTESGPKIVPQLLVGGNTSPTEDLRFFLQKSPNILVATPGRLLEILSSPHVHCSQSSFEILIMDEADRLLDLGFKEDLQKILGRLPKQRRTGLFSASVSEALDQIIRVGLRNPVKIVVKVKNANGHEEQRTPTSLQMTYLAMPASHKIPALLQLLHKLDPSPLKTIVYLSTCAGVDYYQYLLSHILSLQKFSMLAVSLHGKHPPGVRNKNFTLFTNSTIPALLITTDVAARGLDIPQVDLVVQMDPPNDPKDFLHRCGRAGRAGRKGLSVIFLHQGREEDYIPFLQVRKTPIAPLQHPNISISDEEDLTTTKQLQNLIKTDRALHDKGQRAFVSWVRSYSKHQAASIFRIADLDWTSLAAGWGLLKLPRMPELKGLTNLESTIVPMNWDTYKYKDSTREKRRLEELNTDKTDDSQATVKRAFKQKPQSWSQKHEAQEERNRRREQRHAKRQRERVEKMNPEEKAKQAELEGMIKEIKQSRLLEEAPFEGFE